MAFRACLDTALLTNGYLALAYIEQRFKRKEKGDIAVCNTAFLKCGLVAHLFRSARHRRSARDYCAFVGGDGNDYFDFYQDFQPCRLASCAVYSLGEFRVILKLRDLDT